MPSTALKTRPKRMTERLNVRVTEPQARLIRLAAKETRATMSSFVIESACLRAEEALASQHTLIYTPKQWAAFVAALDRPAAAAKSKPRLRRLLTQPSILERR
ncbi:DUF1778 domain-containing protein [Granulicella arctica]|uniref:Uncharacterized protein (DUF1778 family) n=1 Tax=Granulicella arctica TaxID=940613 RepID=A0A7Y9PE72_9BACT|nr:DUF1778 domain-containing protein [Granulicella arctica]NYF78277.1 uncharacterized protein (DUF1778 family) [Granulicella arctica]